MLVDKPITGTAESDFVVELNAINSKQGAGISVNNVIGDINVTNEVSGNINIAISYGDRPTSDTALSGTVNIYGAIEGSVYVGNVGLDLTAVGYVEGSVTVEGSVGDIYVNSVDDYINIDGNVGGNISLNYAKYI